MEDFILRIIGIICTTIMTCAILITRKDDISITAVVIAAILEVLALFIIFFPKDILIDIISKFI